MMNILVINLGLKSIRAIVFDPDGRQLFSASRPVHTALMGVKAEQDANEWPGLLHECLVAIRTGSTLAPTIRYATVTTSSSCSLGLDVELKPVTPVYIVSDGRALDEAVELSRHSEFESLEQGGMANFPASSPLAKFAWLKRAEPETAKLVKYWVNAGDYLVGLLTGQLLSDPLNAEKCRYRDHMYDEAVLDAAGLKVQMLPRVVEIGTLVPLSREFVQRYGFSEQAELVVTSYDAICAVLGSSDGAEATACDVSGTVTSVRIALSRAQNGSFPLLSQNIGGGGLCLVGCSNNFGGGIIEWYKQFLRVGSLGDVYAQLEAEAGLSAPGAQGVIFLPYLLGERAPFYEPLARGTFFGMSRETTPSDLTRAVVESTAFVTRDLVGAIQSQGIQVDRLSVSGGLARIGLVNQIKADVTGLPVYVPENFESTAVGAFLLAGAAIKLFPNLRSAAAKVVKFRHIITPNEELHALYGRSFCLFKEINQSLGACYRRHAEIQRHTSSYRKVTLSNL